MEKEDTYETAIGDPGARAMNAIVVGIADCQASRDSDSYLVTYALGSCIAVGAYDPVSRVGGMLHFMLPESSMDKEKAKVNPAMFADSGIAHLLDRMSQCGADTRRLRVRLAGGTQTLEHNDVFKIGKRNYMAARKNLWKLGILLEGEAVGGNASRNLGLSLRDGEFWVKTSEPGLSLPQGLREGELAVVHSGK